MEKKPEVFINGKDTVSVRDINRFKRHRGSAFHVIFIVAGSVETDMAADRNKLSFTLLFILKAI